MHIVALINECEVIVQVLRHLGSWKEGVLVHSGVGPPAQTDIEPWLDDRLAVY
jgi:hypothetical protein